jgi:hypothetical protein
MVIIFYIMCCVEWNIGCHKFPYCQFWFIQVFLANLFTNYDEI